MDGRDLFQVVGVSAVPASRRAQVIAQRIRALAADTAYTSGGLTIRDEDGHTAVVAGGTVIVSVYDADARLENVGRGALASAIGHRIDEAVLSYREERTAPYLIQKGIVAVVALIAFAIVLVALHRLLRSGLGVLERQYRVRGTGLHIRSFEIMRAEQVWSTAQRVAAGAWWLTLITGVLLYLGLVLTRFPWTRGAADNLLELVLSPLGILGRGLAAAVPGLAFVVVLTLILRYALKVARLFFLGVSAGAVSLPGFDRDWAMPTYGLLRVAVLAFGVVVAFPYIPGSNSLAFKGVSIFIGVLFSLGSSSAIANVIAGYMLIYRRAFKVGDRVRVGSVMGDVMLVRLQATYLRTIKNEEVILPNATVLGSEVINYSSLARKDGLILHTEVGIGYETPWRQVEAMLLLAASRTSGLMNDTVPYVRQKALGDFCVTYELNAYCGDARRMDVVYTDLHRQILDVFNEYGVQIMTPAYETDPAQPKVVPQEQWYAAPAKGRSEHRHPASPAGKEAGRDA